MGIVPYDDLIVVKSSPSKNLPSSFPAARVSDKMGTILVPYVYVLYIRTRYGRRTEKLQQRLAIDDDVTIG
jgi:hypothetical protein